MIGERERERGGRIGRAAKAAGSTLASSFRPSVYRKAIGSIERTLRDSGYGPRGARAIAIAAGVLVASPLSLGTVGALSGALPLAAAASPGAVEAAVIIGGAKLLKDPRGFVASVRSTLQRQSAGFRERVSSYRDQLSANAELRAYLARMKQGAAA